MKTKTRSLIHVALFAALTSVLAQISIPLGFTPIPVSLGTLGGLLAVSLLPPLEAILSQVVYLALGLAGVPVFANFTATAKLAGPTGGYLVGYIFMAAGAALLIRLGGRKWYVEIPAMILGVLLCYTFGTLWFMKLTGNALLESLAMCVIPFLLGDAIKIATAFFCGAALRKRLKAANLL